MSRMSLHKKCPYLELFWSVFSHIWTEYGEIRSISPYSARMRESTDQNNSEYGHFLRSVSSERTPNFHSVSRRCCLETYYKKNFSSVKPFYFKFQSLGSFSLSLLRIRLLTNCPCLKAHLGLLQNLRWRAL